MNRRQNEGAETIARLREWARGQAASERLVAQVLRVEGFKAVDPSHPLGGPDRLKDVVCEWQGTKWIGAAYFPRGQQSFSSIKAKFQNDPLGLNSNGAAGIAFVTNQELLLSEREELRQLGAPAGIDVLHLERVASILDSPACYGIRLEFLDIGMTKEEQLAFIAARDQVIEGLKVSLDLLVEKIRGITERGITEGDNVSVPLAEIKEFKSILDSIAGSNPYSFSYYSSSHVAGAASGHMSGLKVPLADLRAFADILDRITGSPGLSFGTSLISHTGGAISGHVNRLQVPLDQLKEYEEVLDRIIAKRRLLPDS